MGQFGCNGYAYCLCVLAVQRFHCFLMTIRRPMSHDLCCYFMDSRSKKISDEDEQFREPLNLVLQHWQSPGSPAGCCFPFTQYSFLRWFLMNFCRKRSANHLEGSNDRMYYTVRRKIIITKTTWTLIIGNRAANLLRRFRVYATLDSLTINYKWLWSSWNIPTTGNGAVERFIFFGTQQNWIYFIFFLH